MRGGRLRARRRAARRRTRGRRRPKRAAATCTHARARAREKKGASSPQGESVGGAGARTRRRRASRGARRTPLAAVARPPRPPHTRPTQRFSRVSCDLLVPTTGVVSSIPDLGAIRYVPTRLSVAVYVDFPQHSRYTYTLESQSTLSLPPRVPKPTRILKIPLNPHEKRDSLSLSLSLDVGRGRAARRADLLGGLPGPWRALRRARVVACGE